MDWILQHLVEIGAFGSSAVGVVIAIYGWFQRTEVKDFFRSRLQLALEIEELKKKLLQSEKEVQSAHSLATDWRGSVEAMQIRFSTMEKDVSELKVKLQDYEVLKHKFDALFDWAHLLMDSWYEIRDLAKKGQDVSQTVFPPIPPLLADKFQIPESLR